MKSHNLHKERVFVSPLLQHLKNSLNFVCREARLTLLKDSLVKNSVVIKVVTNHFVYDKLQPKHSNCHVTEEFI